MQPVKDIWKRFGELWSLMVGLEVTGKNFTKSLITTHYPRQTVDNMTSWRGHVELVGKPKKPEEPKCIACMLCVTACPSSCIKITKVKPPKVAEGEEKPKAPKLPATWVLDFNLCSLCGSCAEVCPVKSLKFSDNVYLAGFERKDFVFDLMARLKETAKNAPVPPPKPEKKKAEKAEAV